MFILPYLRLSSHTIQILTVGGCTLWEEDSTLRIKEDILEPNDIYLAAAPRVIQLHGHTVVLCEIDPVQTNLNDFYEWKDLPLDNDTICIRMIHDLPCVPPPADLLLAPLPLSTVLDALRA